MDTTPLSTGLFTANETTTQAPLPDYSTFLVVCEVVNAFVFVSMLWIMISMIMHGSRTNKWKKSGPSSMNSGMIYTACICVAALSLPRLILNGVIFHIQNIEGGLEWCEFVFDASDVTGYATLYPIYLFLWLRHRVIYNHPTVHALTGRFVKALSWVTIVGLTLMSIGVLLFLVIPTSYLATPQGCILDPKSDASMGYYVLAGLMILAQGLLLGLFIYPMVRTNEAQKQNSKLESNDRKASSTSGDLRNSEDSSKFDRLICWKRNNKKPKKKANSVTRTIRRSTISAIITVITDLIIVAIATWIMPSTTPLAATNAFYSVGILINVFCALATFGSNEKILTECCRTCRKDASPDSETIDSSSQQRSQPSNNQNGTRLTALNSSSVP
uniref:uncharacterized protein LOC120327092 n=1 Tax=Styela clava TaxID=7725 RepID=UPI00193A74AD|nr:uncharacterized protein LOC120327092 [Styela clava]